MLHSWFLGGTIMNTLFQTCYLINSRALFQVQINWKQTKKEISKSKLRLNILKEIQLDSEDPAIYF